MLEESHWPARKGAFAELLTIGDLLKRQAEIRGPSIALEELSARGEIGRIWTYSELYADAGRLAKALAARHAKGARIAVFANNIPEWLLLEYASAMAGLTLVTVNPAFQPRELKFVLEQSRSEAIYYVEEFRGNPLAKIVDEVCGEIAAIQRRILLTDHAALFAGADHGRFPEVLPSDICQIQYTSGTTGFPKGALLHHWGLLKNGHDALARGGVDPGDSFVHHMPLFHTTGCAILALGGLARGATMLLAPLFDADMLVRVIERERPSFMLGVPTMIVALIEAAQKGGRDVSSIKRIMSGGSMVPPELVRKAQAVFGSVIQIIYGQTEASPVITQTRHDDSFEDLCGTIGVPLDDVEVSIRDVATNRTAPIGVQGEICARGYLIMDGYNDNPEATAIAVDKDGWLHTGDLGRMDERGFLKITGRVKEMIIRGGENLFPAEIENALLEHEAILEIAVVGVPDEKWGEQVACFMRAKGDARPAPADLKAFLRARLAAQKTPAYWIWVDAWPLTGSGKIQKFKLTEAFVRGEVEALKG
ncbi:MAG TPA: long-chain fatty acid--CoA ligase [Parvularcula sp.]|nr:long-chain fatty acid--CoA ligase [Parvularcula sp.]HBS31085.1 long-chain fatty acid--CoA ligase [Parvularcula sp.]